MDDKILDKILIEVLEIKEQMMSKPDREELDQKFDLVLGNIDRFVKLHEILDQELSALRNKYSRLEERLIIVEHRLQLA